MDLGEKQNLDQGLKTSLNQADSVEAQQKTQAAKIKPHEQIDFFDDKSQNQSPDTAKGTIWTEPAHQIEKNLKQHSDKDQNMEQNQITEIDKSNDNEKAQDNKPRSDNKEEQENSNSLDNSEMGMEMRDEKDKVDISQQEKRKQQIGSQQFLLQKSALQIFLKDLQLNQSQRFPYQTIFRPPQVSVFDQIDQQETQQKLNQDQLKAGIVNSKHFQNEIGKKGIGLALNQQKLFSLELQFERLEALLDQQLKDYDDDLNHFGQIL